MITFLYAIWIAYTVGSLSFILLLISLSLVGKYQKKKSDKIFYSMMKARPIDEDTDRFFNN